MTDLDAIVGIYGAVERAVQANKESRARVARLLPLYRDSELHWFDDLGSWLS